MGLNVLLGSGKVEEENSFRETNMSLRKLKQRIAMIKQFPPCSKIACLFVCIDRFKSRVTTFHING